MREPGGVKESILVGRGIRQGALEGEEGMVGRR